MSRRLSVTAGLILSLQVATVLAAPPRFTAMGDLAGTPATTDSVAAPTPPLAAPTPAIKDDADKAAVNDDNRATSRPLTHRPGQDDATPVSRTTTAKTTSDTKHSLLWRLFHRNDDEVPAVKTRKKPGELINTDKHYRPTYDLLQTADLHQLVPGYDARWHVQSSRVMCRMKQQLPSYGYVEFRQGIAQPLEFALYVDNPPAGSGLVEVSAKPPVWRHYVRPKQLGRLELDDGSRAVIASSAWSRRLMLELSDGMQPVLRFWDAADASDDIEIFISAISFQQSLALFNQCLGQLLHYDYRQAEHTVLHFNPDSSRFRKQTYTELDGVLETIKADKGIRDINLEIYTVRDGLARYNFRLASRRAQAVRDYLLKRGISEDRINIKIHTKSRAEMTRLGYSDADVYVVLDRKPSK